jgi:hypothetical protein
MFPVSDPHIQISRGCAGNIMPRFYLYLMLLYNVTVGIDQQAEQEWLTYMKEKHIPAVMRTGMFVNSKIYKVLHDSEDGTISYSIQYFAESIENVQQYLETFAPKLIEDHRQRFLNRHVAFRTLLEEI